MALHDGRRAALHAKNCASAILLTERGGEASNLTGHSNNEAAPVWDRKEMPASWRTV